MSPATHRLCILRVASVMAALASCAASWLSGESEDPPYNGWIWLATKALTSSCWRYSCISAASFVSSMSGFACSNLSSCEQGHGGVSMDGTAQGKESRDYLTFHKGLNWAGFVVVLESVQHVALRDGGRAAHQMEMRGCRTKETERV